MLLLVLGKLREHLWRDVQLAKIHTLYFFQKNQVLLTWKCRQNVEVISFVYTSHACKVCSTYKVSLSYYKYISIRLIFEIVNSGILWY